MMHTETTQRQVSLLLKTPQGDEVGHLLLEDVRVADSEASHGTARPDLSGQMNDLCRRIKSALSEEGVAASLDEIDLRIAVSRALLTPGSAEIVIPLTVQEAVERHDSPRTSAGYRDPLARQGAEEYPEDEDQADTGDDAPDWEDLFDLDALDPEGWSSEQPGEHSATEQGGPFHG